MPRPSEIAADARALYGPLDQRPSAQVAGDGALWVAPQASHALYQVQSANWVQIGQGTAAPAAPAGVPVLYGPYVVDFSDFGPSPMESRTVDLWTPAVGDVLLHIFPDLNTLMQWDSGHLYIGQSPIVPNDPITNNPTGTSTYLTQANNGDIGLSYNGLDTLTSFTEAQAYRAGSPLTTVWICATTDPVQILLAGTGGTDPGSGHVELYALVARAVAP